MKKVKLFKNEHEKPITLNDEGNGVTINDIENNKSFKELIDLTVEEKQKLVLVRLNMADDFKICYPGGEEITKQQLIRNIKSDPQDDYVIAEITNLTELMDDLMGRSKHDDPFDMLQFDKSKPDSSARDSTGVFLFGDESKAPFQQGGFKFREDRVFPCYQKFGNVISLASTNLIRDNFRKQVLNPDCEYVSLCCHGLPSSIEGSEGPNLWEIGSYDKNEVIDKIIHLFSCWTAEKLGPDIINNGAKAFFGYIKPFGWYEVLRPFAQNHYEVFWTCASSVDFLLSLGLSCGKVVEFTKNIYNIWIQYSRQEYPSELVTILIKDRDNFRGPTASDKTYGDYNARLKSATMSEKDICSIMEILMPAKSLIVSESD